MTSTAPAPARANRDGRPCPSWCAADHATDATCVGGGGSVGHIWTRAVRAGGSDIVSLCGSLPDLGAYWPSLSVGPRKAEDLALIAELLADLTPDQHRELAAAIRQAAAQITEASGE